jgi:hypothetical protein
MPRHFFHLLGGISDLGEVGTVLAGPQEARAAAVTAAAEQLKDTDGTFWNAPEWRMHVTDEDGATICVLSIQGKT